VATLNSTKGLTQVKEHAPPHHSPIIDPNTHDLQGSGSVARVSYGAKEVQFQFTTPQSGPPPSKKVYHAKGSGLPIGKSASSATSLGVPQGASSASISPTQAASSSSQRPSSDTVEKGPSEVVVTGTGTAPNGAPASIVAGGSNGSVPMLIPNGPPPGTPVRTCKQCGQPGRYKDGKCVEKWGPGPAGPGTVCDRCRKKMKRVEKRTTQEAMLAQQQQQQQLNQNGSGSGMGGMQSVMRVNPYPAVTYQGRRSGENGSESSIQAAPQLQHTIKKEAPVITPIHVHQQYQPRYSHSPRTKDREPEANSDLDAEGDGDAEGELELAADAERARDRAPSRRSSNEGGPQRSRQSAPDQDEDELDDEILAAAGSGSGA